MSAWKCLGRVLAVAMAVLLAQQALAQAGRPLVVQTRSGASAERAAMLRKADERGAIRVVIGLDIAMPSSEELSPAGAAAERRSLAAGQTQLLGRVGIARTDAAAAATVPFVVATVGAAQLRRLLADPQVTSVEEDFALPLLLSSSVPLVHADVAVTRGFAGNGYSVAVLDTGVAKAHPMLAGKVVTEACYSSNTREARSLCRNGVSTDLQDGAGRPCPATLAGCDHGTHVASIAAGAGGGLTGVAPAARIVAIQVFSRFERSADCWPAPAPCPKAYYSDIVRGLERVYALRKAHRIAAANISIGGGSFVSTCNGEVPALTAIIERLLDADVATVIASGNDGQSGAIGLPACIGPAIAVSSATDQNRVSPFADLSRIVDLMAPGSDIRAAVPGGGFAVKNGTSMAAPHVAGSFAILRQARPKATVRELRRAQICTGLPVTRGGITKARIDIARALREVRSPGSVCPPAQS